MGASAFVGRTDELRALRRWLKDATTDGPRLVLVNGEPGVGKTSLLDRFTADATRRKNPYRVLRAQCHQDVPVPYLPLATALRPIGDLAALLRPLVDDTPERSDERRLHLYVGATDMLVHAADEGPLLLVIDDVQWADHGTLDLLSHLLHTTAVSSGPVPVMTVLAHRPSPPPAVVEFVARLRRNEWVHELDIQPFDPFTLHELVEAFTGERPARKLLDGLGEASAGNPLLARSLLQRLDAFGVLTVRNGQLTYRGGEEILAGPAELDELLRGRVRDLPRAAQDLLVVAAFIGQDEPLELVRGAMGTAPERFAALVDQLVDAGILVDDTVVRFDHPQVRQVMFQRPRGNRRQQLHLRVADHLESLGEPDAGRAVAIAFHLRRAGALADPDRVIQASVRAATHAAAVVAWAEAARSYDAAIEAAEQHTEGPSAFLAHLHARSAYAHWYNHDNPGAEQHALAAVELARQLGDLRIWGEALQTLGYAIWSGERGYFRAGAAHALDDFDAFLHAAGDREPALRARVLRVRGTLHLNTNDNDAARTDMAEAARLVDAADLATKADISFGMGSMALNDLELAIALEHFATSAECALATGNELQRVTATRATAMVRLARGELGDALAAARSAIAAAGPIAAWAECSMATAIAGGVLVALDRYDEAEEACDDAERLTRWAGYPPTVQTVFAVRACARVRRDDVDGALHALEQWAGSGVPGGARIRALVDALSGAGDRVEPWRARPLPERPTYFDAAAYAVAVEIADALDDDERLAWAAPSVRTLAERGLRFTLGWPFFLPRLAAIAAARLGDMGAADHWFAVAAHDAARSGAGTEAALVAAARARLVPTAVP